MLDCGVYISKCASFIPENRMNLESWVEKCNEKNGAKTNATFFAALGKMANQFENVRDEEFIARLPSETELNLTFALYLESQENLAWQAFSELHYSNGANDDLAVPELITYSHSSLDENIYHSTIGKLVARANLSRCQHFSIGQMQGASLFGALEMGRAWLRCKESQATAYHIFAERWCQPVSRCPFEGYAWGDAASAIQVTNFQPANPSLKVNWLSVKHDFQPDSISIHKLCQEAFIQLKKLNGHQSRLLLIDAFPESKQQEQLNLIFPLSVRDLSIDKSAGYLGAAHLPTILQSVFGEINQYKKSKFEFILAIGSGSEGCIGAALLEIVA